MKIPNEQEKRDALNEILIELSKSQDTLKGMAERLALFKRLEDVYCNYDSGEKFRHYYSDIFSTLTLIDGDPDIGSLDILAQNIQTVKNEYSPENSDKDEKSVDISKEIIKLYDHTSLDIARINYTKTMTNETMSELAKNKSLMTELDERVKESEMSMKEISDHAIDDLQSLSAKFQKQQDDLKKEYITILGIFASIVLAFTGGIAFSNSVLENINKPSIYRISLISFIIGLIFFNLIWILIDFIRDINGKTIRKKWIWAIINIIFIVGIIGICFSYKYGLFLPI